MEAPGWRRGRLRDREEGGRWGRWSSRPPVEPAHPSTHHTFLVLPLSAATPVCVVPGTQLAAHDRRPGNSRPISRRMRVILARAHLQPAGALQPSAAKPFRSNITFWTLGLSSLALRVQSWPASVTAAHLPIRTHCPTECLVAFDKGLVLAPSSRSTTVYAGMVLHKHTPRWLLCPSRGQSHLRGRISTCQLQRRARPLSRLGAPEPSFPRLTFKTSGSASWDVISEMEGRLPWIDRKRGRSDGSRALIWFPSIAPQNGLVCRPR